jgi:hypothetical protein
MVNMVNNQMVRCVGYLAMHLNFFSVGQTSDGVKCFAAELGEPSVLNQMVIVPLINECEFTLSKRYSAGGLRAEFAGCRRIEIVASVVDGDYPSSANEVDFLFAGEDRTGRAEHIG